MIKEKIKDRGYSYDLHSKSKSTGCGLLIILIPFFTLPVLASEYTLQKQYNFNYQEPITTGEYVLYGMAQALDLYTTYKATPYPCLAESNPFLPKKPSIQELIIFDTVHNYLVLKYVDDSDTLALHTGLTFTAAYNNYKLLEQGC
jgi:hypothetical protein